MIDSSALRYLLVGVASYAIDISVLTLSWRVLGFPLWLATSAGFWTSFVANFLLSRHWTFASAHVSSRSQLVRYGVLVAINYIVTVVSVGALHRLGMDVLVARTLVLAALTVTTYAAYRGWVFADRDVTRARRG